MKSLLKQKLNGNMIFALCLLAYFIYILVACIGYAAYTRYVPLLVVIMALAMIAHVIYKTWHAEDSGEKESLRDYIEIFLWTLLAPVLLYFLGFLVGGPLFCFVFSKFRMKEKWLASIIPALIILVFVYVLSNMLQVYLYRGLLFML